MNKIVYLVVLIVLFSCKTNTVAQENKQDNNEKPKVEKPKFGDTYNDQSPRIEPGTVLFVGTIKGVSKKGNICGKSYNAVGTIVIENIIGSGSGIVNLMGKGQEMEMAFYLAKPEGFDDLESKAKSGNKFSIKAREGLCPDFNNTVYEIVSFTPMK